MTAGYAAWWNTPNVEMAPSTEGIYGKTAVLCHEIGHALGFGHHAFGGCMDITVRTDRPSAWELATLASWYGPA